MPTTRKAKAQTPDGETEVIVKEKGRFRKAAKSTGKKIISGVKYIATKIGRGTKKTVVGTGHGLLATAQAALFAVRWTLGMIGTIVFGLLRFIMTVLAFLVTVVLVGIFVIAIVLIMGLAYAQYGLDKYLLGTARWMTYSPARREQEGFDYKMFLNSRLESFWDNEAAGWGRRLMDFLSTDLLEEDLYSQYPTSERSQRHMVPEEMIPVDETPMTPETPVVVPPLNGDSTMEEKAAHARRVGLSAEYAEADKVFDEKVTMIIETDKEDPESAFPGAEAYVTYEPGPTLNFELEDFGKYFVDVGMHGDIRQQDFSQFDNHRELLDFYNYMSDSSRAAHHLRNASYWHGRALMLNAYMSDESVLDHSGRVWALLYRRYQSMQNEYSLRYLRTGFVDETDAIAKRRNRHQASRTSEKADA